jgi:hypothetical protein
MSTLITLTDLLERLFGELFRIGAPRANVKKFALARGFEYAKTIDPNELDLYTTSFFGKFDIVRDVVSGTLNNKKFVYFDHDRASGRGEKALMRSVVAFETKDDTLHFIPSTATNGWKFDKSSTHFFLWRWSDKQPVRNIESFLNEALKIAVNVQSSAVMPHSR